MTAGAEAQPDLARVWMTAEAAPDKPLRFVKFLAYGWSSRRSLPSVRDQVAAAVASAKRTGWEALEQAQREYMDIFWDRADVEIEGDEELQQAVRFALFHTLQAGARAERRAIPAKGLTGPGYDGHVFWDTEMFVLPLLTFTHPESARDALRWRHATLGLARERAQQLGLEGAAFPWRTIGGEECSAYWPAGTAAFHVNADIADAVVRYLFTTRDKEFEAGPGLHLLVETARLWRSLGHHDHAGAFHIDGVTGPDEYSAVVDDNVYTNLLAEQNLRMAAEVAARNYEQARGIGVDQEEIAAWRDAAADMHVPYDRRLAIHPQDAKFTHHDMLDVTGLEFPLLLHVPYFQLYRKQVCKQPDLVMAMLLRGDRFTRRREGAQLRLLRAPDGARLLTVGVRAGRGRGRGGAPRAGVRLLRRGRADGPRRPRAQHRRRPAHGVAGGLLDRRRRRLRRDAHPQRRAELRATAAGGAARSCASASTATAAACRSRSRTGGCATSCAATARR